MEKELDTILATMQVTKSNVKGRHWMVTGHEYEALHKMFDKIYKVLDDGTDKVGEIFRQLRMIPPFSMGLCISESKVEDEKLIMPTWDMVASIVSNSFSIFNQIIFFPFLKISRPVPTQIV